MTESPSETLYVNRGPRGVAEESDMTEVACVLRSVGLQPRTCARQAPVIWNSRQERAGWAFTCPSQVVT